MIVAEIAASLEVIAEIADDVQAVRKLAADVLGLLRQHTDPDRNVEAMRGLAAGIAAARSNAVQEYRRRPQAAKTPTPG